MRAEAGLGVNAVLVYDSQRAKLLVLGIMVSGKESIQVFYHPARLQHLPREAEGMEGLEPAMVGLTTLIAAAGDDLHCDRWRG